MLTQIKSIFFTKDDRTKKANTQTLLSFFFQVLSVGLSFLSVPLLIKFLNPKFYGVWITLLSVVGWIALMDFGIGLGLRNKLTEAIASNEIPKAKQYITTAYVVTIAILLPCLIIGIPVISMINWASFFNINDINPSHLLTIVIIVFVGSIINFILSIINQVLYALHKNAFVAITPILVNLILVCVLWYQPAVPNTLVFLSTLYIASSIFVYFALTAIIFNKFTSLRPSLRDFSKDKIKEILQLGGKFFIIQIAAVLIFSTDNLIITKVLGPAEVAGYHVTRQLFAAFSTVAMMVMAPLWSAYTEAYAKDDIQWIKNKLKQIISLMIPLVIVITIIALNFNIVLSFWITEDLNISPFLIISMALYTVIMVWSNIFSYFLNGVGKLYISTIMSVVAAIINIPLSILLAKHFGGAGVIIATMVSLIPAVFLAPYQTYVIINKKRAGIWIR